VPAATVEVLQENDVMAVTNTDDAGRYELTVPPGTYLICATASGLERYLTRASGLERYLTRAGTEEPGRTVTASAGKALTVRFVLHTIPRML